MKYQKLWVAVALSAICACRAYDESLLPPRNVRSSQAGMAGAGAAGSSGEAGQAGQSEPSPGGGAETHCGNGRVDPSEKCDTGILSGTPGACPTICGTTESCQLVQLTGSGCELECHVLERNCEGGDGCCPASCKPADDSDCSGQCGDGIVQTDKGETCEPKPRTPASPSCPNADDCNDDDPCTTDTLSGSAENCNATCKHTPVTTPQGGDGCCPSGANANSDNDCNAQCGNGVREGDEACDGTTGCDATCKLSLSDQQIMCLDTLAETGCERCECMSCAEAMFGCSKSGDASRDQACTMVENCAITERCAGSACYCGTAQFGIDCVYRANGPCKSIIEAAAGTTSATRIDAMYRDPETALGRAQALGNCRRAQCVSECE